MNKTVKQKCNVLTVNVTELCHSVPARRWWYIGSVVVGNVGDKCQQLSPACIWNTTAGWRHPHPSVICVELLGGSRQPMTGRLATHPSNTRPKRDSQRVRRTIVSRKKLILPSLKYIAWQINIIVAYFWQSTTTPIFPLSVIVTQR